MERIKKISVKFFKLVAFCALSVVLCTAFSFESEATSRTQAEAVEWVKSQVGRYIDADGVYGAQCVDLILAYYDYLGVSRSSGNGADYAWNALPSGWQRLQGATPQPGDILVYSASNSNVYGHVAIFESTYSTYHQNFNGHSYVERVTYSYNSFTNPYWGVIRPNWNSTLTPASFFTGLWADNISDNDARINAKINLTHIQSCGFYIGTSLSNMEKRSETVNAQVVDIWYDLRDCYGALSSGTTYYYKIYIVVNGVEYCTDAQTFKTTHTHQYSSTVTKVATCTSKGVKTFSCSCGNSYTEEIPLASHNIVIDSAVKESCTKTGLTEGKHCSVCNLVTVAQEEIPMSSHTDINFDGRCDSCGLKPGAGNNDEAADCDCMCHSSGFMKIIYGIIKFFWKLFGINQTCACGEIHY